MTLPKNKTNTKRKAAHLSQIRAWLTCGCGQPKHEPARVCIDCYYDGY